VFQQLKTGKLPATFDARDFKLATVAELPLAPKGPFGYGRLYSDWGMLGNDQYGDCAWAGPAHETMLFNRIFKGHDVPFTTDAVLSDYASTGFDPKTGANDNGTYCRQMFGYRRSTGIVDANGTRHKIDAYASIDAQDWDTMIRALAVFGAVGIGFNFPGSAMTQFNRGDAWDVPISSFEGGHYVCCVGSMDPKNEVTVITWGRRQIMTRAFYEKCNDETWVPLSLELLRNGYGLRHLDVDALRALLASL